MLIHAWEIGVAFCIHTTMRSDVVQWRIMQSCHAQFEYYRGGKLLAKGATQRANKPKLCQWHYHSPTCRKTALLYITPCALLGICESSESCYQ